MGTTTTPARLAQERARRDQFVFGFSDRHIHFSFESNGAPFHTRLFPMNTNTTDWQEQARLSGLVLVRDDKDNIHNDHPQWRAPEWQESRDVINERKWRYSYLVVRHAENSQRKTIVVLGGVEGEEDDTVNSVFLWNPENGNWCQGPSMIEARVDFTAVVCGNYLYAIGGNNSMDKPMDSIERVSIQELLHSWTLMDRSASNTTATLGWETFRCCLSKPRANTQAITVQDRYIVVAGGWSDVVDNRSSPVASVDIIDTHLPYLRFPFAGPRLNVPHSSFRMEIVQKRIFVISSAPRGGRGGLVEYLDFDPSCLDTTSRGVRSVELPSTSMSWKVHEDPTISNLWGYAVVRVGSCLLLWPGRFGHLYVFDTKRDISWKLVATDSLGLHLPSMVSLPGGIVRFNMRQHGLSRLYCSRLGLVDKQSLLFQRLLDLSDLQIQSLLPRRQSG